MTLQTYNCKKMITNKYLQYKPYKYIVDGKYIKSSHKHKSSIYNFEPFVVCLESLIKDIQDKTLPTKKEGWNNCCLDMVSKYGFLDVNKHIKSSDGFFNYEKEHIAKWKYFIKDVKNIIENKDIDKIEIMNSYLIEDTYIYFDDFNTKNIAYKCNSLSSAIMLYMLTNKQHTKNCIKCNNLFFAKRSDAKYCNGNCARSYQREKGNI